ncbi:nuclear transport factor 2 family protein [Halioglobus maricola]|uniref:Nuclear transport factor 2 family protein n=1 Tax=Halioglobus maricola TaxID=2601894 RepID=A0A5P9NKB6_9GAMM|nr:nuclear transport factor 2 family protein [Halioglobus maricola]QFU76291.1 nuclear transport factor 2 family protein [Halioglobus maricola]
MSDPRLTLWHKAVIENDSELLRDLLDENVSFHSPTVWQPKEGRDITHFILSMVNDIFQDFTYHRQWIDGNNMALEFSAAVKGKQIKGIDLIRWNQADKIVHFEVMMRPINGLQLMLDEMTMRLEKGGFLKS